MCDLSCLASFTQHVFKVHSFLYMLPVHSFFMAKYYYIVLLFHILFIHSSGDGHLGYFPFGAPVNSAAVNIHEQIVWILVFNYSGYYLRAGLLESRVILCLIFWGAAKLSPQWLNSKLLDLKSMLKKAVKIANLINCDYLVHSMSVLF